MLQANESSRYCEYCDDGDGRCAFPYYGVAPHYHGIGRTFLGSTRFLPESEWPENFSPDEDSRVDGVINAGTYEYCLICRGRNDAR